MNFKITTPLYYVNAKPHLGSLYTTIACDSLARFHRLEGNKVLFITGVDEHGLKIQRTASDNNISPQDHCDNISSLYMNFWSNWNISFDRFIRTTSNKHIKFVSQFYKRVEKSGDIRLGRQEGWYCVGCEEFKDIDSSSKKPYCNIHSKELEWRDEENLFFCLSKYQNRIEDLINSDNFIFPKSRKNEIRNFVAKGLNDFSISRVNVPWGIPVPGYPGHTFYVWFDALLGYISASMDENSSVNIDQLESTQWPASIHVIGKDILRFHSVYWPAMLMSAGIDLPRKVFGHGFLTRDGKKMGKSLGNILDPQKLIEEYGIDAVRWYLLRDIEFGQDGDFQTKRFIEIVNNDLANSIGNLLNRSSSMSRKWFENKIPPGNVIKTNNFMKDICLNSIKEYKIAFSNLDFKTSSELILYIATKANQYLNEQEPWKKIKDNDQKSNVGYVLYNVLESVRIIGLLLKPIVPNLSEKILQQLGIQNISEWHNQLQWGLLDDDSDIPSPIPVMSKLEFNDNI